MTGAFDSLGYFTLKFQAGSGDPAGQNLALFVEQFHQKVRVFVINVLDTRLLEAAVFLAAFAAVAD